MTTGTARFASRVDRGAAPTLVCAGRPSAVRATVVSSSTGLLAWFAAAAALTAATPACGDRAVTPPATSASAHVGAPAATATAVSGPSTSKRRDDPRWRSALTGDEARAAELAGDVGLVELVDALRDEDSVRATSLRALPFARDRDGSLEALATALEQRRGDGVAVADAIERVLLRERRDVETASRTGARACVAVLERVTKEGGRDGLDAARAESLGRRIAE